MRSNKIRHYKKRKYTKKRGGAAEAGPAANSNNSNNSNEPRGRSKIRVSRWGRGFGASTSPPPANLDPMVPLVRRRSRSRERSRGLGASKSPPPADARGVRRSGRPLVRPWPARMRASAKTGTKRKTEPNSAPEKRSRSAKK